MLHNMRISNLHEPQNEKHMACFFIFSRKVALLRSDRTYRRVKDGEQYRENPTMWNRKNLVTGSRLIEKIG
jgi:hypothetical protein